jgi:uncharacterized protein
MEEMDGMTVAHVRGSSGVEVTPDRARLHITVRGEGPTDLAATEAYNSALRLLQEKLAEHGLHGLVRAPQSWSRDEDDTDSVVDGDVSVEVDELATVRILAGYLAAAEGVSLRWLQWLLSGQAELRRQARKDAVAAARVAADDFADALGMEVEAIESISDPGVGYAEDFGAEVVMAMSKGYAEEQEGAPTVDVSEPTPVTISASVHATYRLRPVG